MADNVTLNAMSGGSTVAADEVTDGTLGTVKVQYVKLMDGTLDGSGKAAVDATYGLAVDIKRTVNVVLGAGASTVGAVTQASGPWTVVERGATIAHGQGSVTTSAAQFLASGSTRRSVTIQNLGNDYVYIGATGITANNGIRLSPGQTLVIDKSPNAAIFAIASSGTQTCSYLTESD
jgi:hypothetical protein